MNQGVFIPRFPLGQVVMTQGIGQLLADNNLDEAALMPFLRRHQCGDWGEMPDEDKKSNDKSALQGGFMIMSCYRINDERIWLITEADRAATTFLLPEEY